MTCSILFNGKNANKPIKLNNNIDSIIVKFVLALTTEIAINAINVKINRRIFFFSNFNKDLKMISS